MVTVHQIFKPQIHDSHTAVMFQGKKPTELK